MTKLEQLHLFLRFHFAPDSEVKHEVWSACCSDPYTEAEVEKVVSGLIDGSIGFTDYEVQLLRIVAEPGPPDDKAWAERMRGCVSLDTEASHADADRLLANLVKELGYDETAAAWQSIDKWYT